MIKKARSVYSLPRNDLDAVRVWYAANKPIRRDDVEVLCMLQDDPGELLAESATWETRDDVADAAAANDARPTSRRNREKKR